MRNLRMRLRSGVGCLGQCRGRRRFAASLIELMRAFFLTYRVEKYRPDTLDDVVSHKDITGTSQSICTTYRIDSKSSEANA